MRKLLPVRKITLREVTACKYISLNTCFITGAGN